MHQATMVAVPMIPDVGLVPSRTVCQLVCLFCFMLHVLDVAEVVPGKCNYTHRESRANR